MADIHQWARETVVDWIKAIDDIPTLQAWFDACRSRLANLGAARRGIPLEVGKDIYADGTVYVITNITREVESIDVSSFMDPMPEIRGVETLTIELRRTGP